MPQEQRKILRDWLFDVVETRRFPGVEWVNRDELEFKIPWLHKAKRGWTEEYSLIFRAWSQYTGNFKPTDDDAVLKTRLRCALTKAHDIEHIKEKSSTDDNDCYRVYQLKEKKPPRKLGTMRTGHDASCNFAVSTGDAPIPTPVADAKSSGESLEMLASQAAIAPYVPEAGTMVEVSVGEDSSEEHLRSRSPLRSSAQYTTHPIRDHVTKYGQSSFRDTAPDFNGVIREIPAGATLQELPVVAGSDGAAYQYVIVEQEPGQEDAQAQPMVFGLSTMQIGSPNSEGKTEASSPPYNSTANAACPSPYPEMSTTPHHSIANAMSPTPSCSTTSGQVLPQSSGGHTQLRPPYMTSIASKQGIQLSPPAQPYYQPRSVGQPQISYMPMAGALSAPPSVRMSEESDHSDTSDTGSSQTNTVFPHSVPAVPMPYNNAHSNYMIVSLLYDGKAVLEKPYRMTCTILPNKEQQDSLVTKDRSAMMMPSLYGVMKSKKSEEDARRLLANMDNGIILTFEEGNIYAERKCYSHAFYSNFFEAHRSMKLERNQKTLVFSMDEFLQSINEMRSGGKKPCSVVCIGIGRKWYFTEDESVPVPTPVAVKVKSFMAYDILQQMLMDDITDITSSLQISKPEDPESVTPAT